MDTILATLTIDAIQGLTALKMNVADEEERNNLELAIIRFLGIGLSNFESASGRNKVVTRLFRTLFNRKVGKTSRHKAVQSPSLQLQTVLAIFLLAEPGTQRF